MAGAIAAIGGVSRGKQRAKMEAEIKHREEIAKRRRESAAEYEQAKDAVKNLMEKYDKNGTGYLSKDDLITMFTDCNLEIGACAYKVSLDEVDSLMALCDRDSDGKIDTKELLNATKTWCHYIHKSEETRALMEKHDTNKTGYINHGELRPLLVELNEGQDVPDDVLKWVWREADLREDGQLDPFELTRAIAAWYVWLPEDQPGGKPGMIAGQLDKEAMPERQEPKSVCCVMM